MKEEEFEEKFVKTIIQIRHQMDRDRLIYGDAFIEFTDRKIEVIKPDKVTIKLDICPKCGKKPEEKDEWNLAGCANIRGYAKSVPDIKTFIQKVKEDIDNASSSIRLKDYDLIYKIIDKRAGKL